MKSLHYRYQYYVSLAFVVIGVIIMYLQSPLITTVIPAFLFIWFVASAYYFFIERKKVAEGAVYLLPTRDVRSTRFTGLIFIVLAGYMYYQSPAKIMAGGPDCVLFLFVAVFALYSLSFGPQSSALRMFSDGIVYSRIGQFLPWSKIEGYTVDPDRFAIIFHLENMKTVTMRLEYGFFRKNLEQVEVELQKHVSKR
jgi:hypothetical protein